jgi:CheY-like chemotaxis protein
MAGSTALLLVVDDDEPTREALQEILEREGHRVVTASNGAEAIARMRQTPQPELVIMDLMMPVMDGWDLAALLRAEPAFADPPMIIVTAFGERALQRAPVATAYLSKPLKADRVIQEVARALERRMKKRGPSDHPPAAGFRDATTPIRGSAAYPMLQHAAEDTARQLASLATEESVALADELMRIAGEIRQWRPENRPIDDERRRVTDTLIEKTRLAFALLGRPGTEE